MGFDAKVFDPERYTHPSDRAALKALKAIPGFSALMKGFMNIWNEPQQKILNMSSRIRLDENQMRKYYDMLPPICEKLGIPVPELYLEMDVRPNAYTNGDTNPYIVLTSGLLETLPDALVPTVLAHECGHIACHHVLYSTMGSVILSGASAAMIRLLPLGNLLSVPLEVAFYYWMRCSEFSADRAAVLCDGTPEKQQEVCMRLAGWSRNIPAEANMDAFIRQAESYRDLISGSAWNKTLEFLILSGRTHPLMALRATECEAWAKSEEFRRLLNHLPPLTETPKPASPEEAEEAGEKLPPSFDWRGLLRSKIADTGLFSTLQECRIGKTGGSLFLPKQYKKVRSLPEDPPDSSSYGLETEGAQILLTVYPKSMDQAMAFDNDRNVIDSIHAALDSNQGLIEVKSGRTAAGRKYIYSIVKTVMLDRTEHAEGGPSRGVQYCLTMDIAFDGFAATVQGFFNENGTTGVRDTAIFNLLRSTSAITVSEDSVTGWLRDPYDDSWSRGILMNRSEDPAYDEAFPLHPLSEARKLVQALTDSN